MHACMHAHTHRCTPTHANMHAHILHTHICLKNRKEIIDCSLATHGLVLSVAGACQISPRSLPPFSCVVLGGFSTVMVSHSLPSARKGALYPSVEGVLGVLVLIQEGASG